MRLGCVNSRLMFRSIIRSFRTISVLNGSSTQNISLWMIAFALIPVILASGGCNATGHATENAKGGALAHPNIMYVYVIIEQGIYATHCTLIPHPPYMRESVCGALLLQVENTLDSSVVPEKGEMRRFFGDLTLKGMTREVLYMRTANVLIHSSKEARPLQLLMISPSADLI